MTEGIGGVQAGYNFRPVIFYLVSNVNYDGARFAHPVLSTPTLYVMWTSTGRHRGGPSRPRE